MKGGTFSGFLFKAYKRGGGKLMIADDVLVHPTETSEAREPYKAAVVADLHDGVVEVGTKTEGGHFSIMRDYLFDRLEKIE
jgi:hypothetical protein